MFVVVFKKQSEKFTLNEMNVHIRKNILFAESLKLTLLINKTLQGIKHNLKYLGFLSRWNIPII